MPCLKFVLSAVLLLADHCLSGLNALLDSIGRSACEGVRIVRNSNLESIPVLIVVIV